MKQRLSIFDLQEGKVYNAFDGARQLGKRYTVQSGKLMNASKNEDPHNLEVYEGCNWVPLKASIRFEEVKAPSTPVSILGLKQGLVYRPSAQISGLVTRKGNKLMFVEGNKTTKSVDLDIVNLSTMFTAIGEMAKARKARKASKSSARR
jgi:hypothetical protein